MKAKSILLGIFALFAMQTMFAGPLKNPSAYQDEIEDSFRYQIAVIKYYTPRAVGYGMISSALGVDMDDDSMTRFLNVIERRVQKIYNDGLFEYYPCRKALQEFSSSNQMAATILQYYYAVPRPRFSKFIELGEDGGYYYWTATELNSGLDVLFKISSKWLNFDYDLDFDVTKAMLYAASIDEY